MSALRLNHVFAVGGLFAALSVAQAQQDRAVKLQLGSNGDQIAFDKSQLQAKAGQAIELTFKNNASKENRMQHGWVLVKPGTESKVVDAGAAAGAGKNYVPESPDVIAHSKLLNPGESAVIKFKAPAEPGSYPYLCPFPGHAQSMKGVLTITK